MLHKSFDNVDIYLCEFIKYKVTAHYNITNATLATDPRFSGRGAPVYYLAKICRKLHKNDENWTGGMRV